MRISRTYLIRLVATFCLLWIAGSVIYYGMYQRLLKDGGDAWGYYIYLPSVFVSGDLPSLEYIAEVRKGFSPWSIDTSLNHLGVPELYIAPNGNPVIKYTSGVALMLSPFFMLAHGIAWLSPYEADGFNPVYWLSMYFGVIAWVLLGMALLFRTMVRYVRPGIALATLALIAIGSNLYYFLAYNSPMSHAPLFALYAILIWLTDRFYRQPRWKDAFGIGVLCGVITVIRPVELICVFIPLLWAIEGLRERWQFILRQYRYYLVAGLGFVLSLVPQLLYWKVTTGDWLYYSYGEEGFNFLNPRVWKGLTGFMNGWLVYTPLFLLSLPGLWYLYRRHRGIFIPLAVFMVLHVYIVFSWHNWYYINSFGSRPMVETYALMAFPLALGIQHLSRGLGKYLVMVLCIFFVVLNQFQVWQVSQGMMSSEEGNRAYYWALFGKAKMTEEILIAADTQLAQPKRNRLDSLGVLWSYADTLATYPDGVRLLPPHTDRVVEVQLADVPIQRGDYLRISVEALSKGWNSNRWGMANITTYLSHEGKPYRWKWNRINNKLGNPEWNLYGGQPDVWGEAWYFYKIPRQYKPGDVLHVFLSNPSHLDMYIRSFQVEHWR